MSHDACICTLLVSFFNVRVPPTRGTSHTGPGRSAVLVYCNVASPSTLCFHLCTICGRTRMSHDVASRRADRGHGRVSAHAISGGVRHTVRRQMVPRRRPLCGRNVSYSHFPTPPLTVSTSTCMWVLDAHRHTSRAVGPVTVSHGHRARLRSVPVGAYSSTGRSSRGVSLGSLRPVAKAIGAAAATANASAASSLLPSSSSALPSRW